MTFRTMGERASESNALAGWARLLMAFCVPILVAAVIGLFSTLMDARETTATTVTRLDNLSDDVRENTTDIRRVETRMGTLSNTIASLPPQIAGMADDIREIKEALLRISERR